jgi:transposase-like protein
MTRFFEDVSCDSQAQAVSDNFRKFPLSADRLDEKQLIAIELLLRGKSNKAIAQSLDVTPRTLYNWRQDELFDHELSRRRNQLWSDAAERLRAMIHPSLDVLEQQLHDNYDRARFRAANAVLRHSDLRKAIPPARARQEE